MKEKTYVEDVDRNMYDFRNDEKDAYRIKNGLTEDIVEKISEEKHDPEWMHDFRLNSLKVYNEMKVPNCPRASKNWHGCTGSATDG